MRLTHVYLVGHRCMSKHFLSSSFHLSSHTVLQQLHRLLIEYRISFKIANITFCTLHFSQPAYLHSALHAHHSTHALKLSNTNLLFVPFVLISLCLVRAASVLQLLIFGIHSVQLFECVPAPTPSVATSRPITSSRLFNLLNPFLLAP